MRETKRKCPKCGKTIAIDEFEYCCPLCGEFIKNLSNDLTSNFKETREEVREKRNAEHVKTEFKKLYVIILTLFGVLTIITATLFFKPQLLLQFVHYGWIVAAFLIVSFFSFFSGFSYKDMREKTETEKRRIKIFYVLPILTIILLISALTTVKDKTIEIDSVEDFKIMNNLPNAENCKYILIADIDFQNQAPDFWGKFSLEEDGVFDGNDHCIMNINIQEGKGTDDGHNTYYGMFFKNSGTIKNLIVKDSVIKARGFDNFYMGTLCGENSGRIENCKVFNVYLTLEGDHYEPSYLGGIAGENQNGEIENSQFLNQNDRTDYSSALKISSSYHDVYAIAHRGKQINCIAEYH